MKTGDVSITDCPNGDMLADVFTKQLQDSLFKSISNSVSNINNAVLNHKVGKEQGVCWELLIRHSIEQNTGVSSTHAQDSNHTDPAPYISKLFTSYI